MDSLCIFKNNFIKFFITTFSCFHEKVLSQRKHLYFPLKLRTLLNIVLLSALVFSFAKNGMAQSLREKNKLGPNDVLVSLPDIMPLAYVENSQKKGFLINLANAMDSFYQKQGVNINGNVQKGRVVVAGIFPFQRSIQNVKDGIADFHIPFLVNPFLKIEDVEKSEGFTYSSAITFYVVFAMYANKNFAEEIHLFESQIGKKLSEFSNAQEYTKFDEFLKSKKRKIGVDRAHTYFYKFKTEPMSNNLQGLKMVVGGRLDAYIHNMDECDMEIKTQKINSTGMEKINYKKFVVRMIVSPTEKGKRIDQIVSAILWGLQGRKPADVPLRNLPDSGKNKELPYNPYHQSAAFKQSEFYTAVGPVFNPVYMNEIAK